jgi:2-polyprenyl-6-methoxyphenol hydroxylase-like FAD-dependent oxidoreductase
MKAIVCGAGVAGLTLASRLGAAGWQVVLVEAAPGLRDQGYMLDFFGPGYDTAERMDLIPRLRDLSYQIPEVIWLDRSGRSVAQLHYRNVQRALKGRLLTLMRGDLERLLFDTLPHSVDLRFGCTVDEIKLWGQCIEVALSSGIREYADVVVGADGVHSRIRNLMLGDTEEAFRFLGMHTAAFVFEDAKVHGALAGKFMLMSVPGRLAGFYPIRAGKVAAFFAVDVLEQQFARLGWLIPSALQHARQLPGIYYDSVGQIKLTRWSFGRVTLVGDACQAVSPVAGQGASVAMAAAYVLAHELASTQSLADSLRRYEHQVRPLVERRQAAGKRAARWLVPATRWKLGLRNAAVRVADRPGMTWLLRPLIA